MKNHVALSIAVTSVLCAIAYVGAFILRFDFGAVPEAQLPCLFIGLPIMVVIRLATLGLFKVHRGLYRYVSMHDFVCLSKAVILGTLVFAAFWLLFLNNIYHMPRSIFLLEGMLCMSALSGWRIAVRLYRNHRQLRLKQGSGANAGRALIIGAGNMGEQILRMIDRRFLGEEYDVVGFADDDQGKIGNSIHGVHVLGSLSAIPQLVQEHEVQVIVFAISEPPQGLYEQVVAGCDGLHVRFNTVSVLRDMSSGEISYDRMRRLSVEDLLGRKPITCDTEPVQHMVQDKVVLVTGAGGSIGSELSRQLASFKPSKIVLYESGESPLFEIDRELRQLYPELNICPFIGDIKHKDVIERAFEEHRPDFVYHAAAYKHVPLMESHPDEAVLNNVRGTRFLAEIARKYKVERFVMISSDKAVRPTNVMGATKRMCELVIQSMNGGDTIFTAVRFGNVLGSNGSVIPIFRKQLEAGGPLTITHEDMTRYFMTIPEAVTLVLQCGVIAEAGDVFVLDMGTPVKIMDLARNMIRLSGLRENVDVSIKVTGLRPGEKMYEELVAYGEALQPTRVEKVNVLKQKMNLLASDVLLAMMYRLEEFALNRKLDESRDFLWRLIELDNERAQKGIDGLIEKNRSSLMSEWRESIGLATRHIEGKSKGRVLAVVTDLDQRDILEHILFSAGYEIDCMKSSAEAMKLLASDHAYTAVLCDFIMPTDTAWRIEKKIQNAGFNVPVIAMSMYDHAMLAEVLEVNPALPVLQKPFSVEQVSQVLRELETSLKADLVTEA